MIQLDDYISGSTSPRRHDSVAPFNIVERNVCAYCLRHVDDIDICILRCIFLNSGDSQTVAAAILFSCIGFSLQCADSGPELRIYFLKGLYCRRYPINYPIDYRLSHLRNLGLKCVLEGTSNCLQISLFQGNDTSTICCFCRHIGEI